MGCLLDEEKAKIKGILVKAAEQEADEIISFTEQLHSTCPEGQEEAKAWAEKQAQAFADARIELTKKFTDSVKMKMGL